MGCQLWCVDDHQRFVVLMGCGRAPVERSGDHGAVVDDSKLVWLVLQKCRPALILSVSVGRSATSQANLTSEGALRRRTVPEMLLELLCDPFHYFIPVPTLSLAEQPHRGIPESGVAF